jgi:hypothetical protein
LVCTTKSAPLPIHRLDREQVGALADVAVHELHARLAQTREVELRAAALERVERDHLVTRRREREAQVGAHEAGPAGDEDARHR